MNPNFSFGVYEHYVPVWRICFHIDLCAIVPFCRALKGLSSTIYFKEFQFDFCWTDPMTLSIAIVRKFEKCSKEQLSPISQSLVLIDYCAAWWALSNGERPDSIRPCEHEILVKYRLHSRHICSVISRTFRMTINTFHLTWKWWETILRDVLHRGVWFSAGTSERMDFPYSAFPVLLTEGLSARIRLPGILVHIF
jgi:hypothetical protein